MSSAEVLFVYVKQLNCTTVISLPVILQNNWIATLVVLKADISHACLSFAFVFWEDQYAMLWTQTNAKRKTTRFNNQFHSNNLRNSRAGRNVVNNSCSPSLISSPLYSLPPFTPSSLLHTLFITAYFPLAIAIVSHPPTNQPTPCIIHMRAGVCPESSLSFPELHWYYYRAVLRGGGGRRQIPLLLQPPAPPLPPLLCITQQRKCFFL